MFNDNFEVNGDNNNLEKNIKEDNDNNNEYNDKNKEYENILYFK